ncbi:transcriptional repressor CTCF-like isoform X2 [Aphidius gifuensis]|uniref:transcriptional repressor CTCF-like isoform X2 n=1 Tax=Aphidius gifuensis TaxID=684658 RepID=UPI001CDC35AB|nr:transcriptional repressor CTCF-like isoform X2 [Aphidius gifuensis]
MTTNATTIKLEENQESVTEIQSYIQTFKEIEGAQGEQLHHVLEPVEGITGGEEGGSYFVDETGQYYYQSNSDDPPVMTQVQIEEIDEVDENQQGQYEVVEELENLGTVNNDGKLEMNGNGDSNSGYQSVTIVPNEGNSNEVSYIVVVKPNPDDETIENQDNPDNEDNQDLTVYDFEDNDGEGNNDEEVDGDKTKVVKYTPKKTQAVSHMCNYCNYTSPKRYLLSRHMKSHSEERPHKCSVCERGFKTLASLQNHINTHTGTKPHRCKYCNSAFTTSGELVRHVRYRHTHEKPHKCTECDYASVELSKLKRHIRCHTGERPYQCPHCTYASPDTFKLKRHLRIHTGEKPYGCDICKARFTQSNSLKAHKLVHNIGDKPIFQCELCPTTCGRKTDLRIHVQKLHTSDKPLKCKRCGKTFPDRYSFKLHNKTHEGEKCFKCELCPYASISARHLESHMLIHTDQKPYQCDHCYQSFRQKQLLKRHCNLYHNPTYTPPAPQEKTHQCPECERSFRHKGNLIRHMAVHDPESSLQEKNKALKIGRQKKIQIIDGQRVEVMTGYEDEEEEEEEEEEDEDEMMAVEGSDGQQYVVLEVIQLADNQGTQQMAVDGEFMMQDPLSEEHATILGDIEEEEEEEEELELEGEQVEDIKYVLEESKTTKNEENSKHREDVETCFGFDGEDEENEDE